MHRASHQALLLYFIWIYQDSYGTAQNSDKALCALILKLTLHNNKVHKINVLTTF